MADKDYARASVLLFDPVHVNQRTTRYALFEIGFRQIECVSNLRDFKECIEESGPTLIVAESSATDHDVFKLVRSIRSGEVGKNPFVVILLTTWGRDTTHIKKAIECGADDVIVRPFSTMFAEERVRALISNRKEFIVTSDYIGPDRRKDAQRESSAQSVKVPNFLQATVNGDQEALATGAKWVKEAQQTVVSERIRRVAMRAVVAVELQLAPREEGAPSPKLDHEDLIRTARELKMQLIRAERGEAAEVAEALIDQVNSLGEDGGVTPQSLQLVKELAMGAYAAYANGDTIERSKDEIGKTVTNLRKRIAERAESAAARRAARESQQDADEGAGQDAAPGIKRAAM